MTKHALVRDGEIERFADIVPNVDQSKLAAGKPRWLPVVVEGYEPFDPVSQVRTGPLRLVDAERVVETYIVTDKGEDDVAQMKAGKVALVKAEAQRRILDIMPQHRQTNWLALKAEMDLRHGPDPAGWPVEVQEAIAVVLPLWDQIKDLRTRSDEIEASVMAMSTPAAIHSFNPLLGWNIA